jgi:hypothetical protein
MKQLFLFLLISLTFSIYGQNKLRYKDIDRMDRGAIIKLAKERINEYNILLNDTSFNFSFIDTIRILKNKYKKRYIVEFQRFTWFVPENSSYYYGYTVDLIENIINLHMGLNGGNTGKPLKFYHPTQKDIEKTEFVLKSLQITENKGYIVIKEFDKYYEIGYGPCGEKVDKSTGKRYDNWDEISIIDPKDQFIETKTE